MNSKAIRILTFLAALSMCVGTVLGGTMPRASSPSSSEEETQSERQVEREHAARDRRRPDVNWGNASLSLVSFSLDLQSAKSVFASAPVNVQGEKSLRNGTGGPLLL